MWLWLLPLSLGLRQRIWGSLPRIAGTDTGPPPVNHVIDTPHCQENNPPAVQQTTHHTEHQCPRIESTTKAVGLQDPCTGPWKPKASGAGGVGDAHGALHLLVLDVVGGQTGGVGIMFAGVLMVTSVVWVESVVGKEGSVSGQSNVILALLAERCRMLLHLGTNRASIKPPM